jgi:uncharacterized protein YacL
MSKSRLNQRSNPVSDPAALLPAVPEPTRIAISSRRFAGQNWDFWAVRLALISVSVLLCTGLAPFGFHGLPAAGLGFFVAMIILLAELRLRHAETSGLIGGALGIIFGLLAALLITLVVSRTSEPEPTKSFLEFASLFAFGYLGLALGAHKGDDFRDYALPRSVEKPHSNLSSLKILDTSVLIDGRIADICETHFLDGTLGVPRFVLHELQQVADSADALKRQRGRRGLEVLQRMQKMPGLEVRVLEEDLSGSSGVDQMLIELARRLGAKIVTNDFNLNKVARVQGIAVLNINELANTLKPAVLPGEPMRVLILREGKESAQGVAYLDDGTMVVVDGARRLIHRTVDIVVTSVHQTPAGKMIFGRLDDRTEPIAPRSPQHAASDCGTRGESVGSEVANPRPASSTRFETSSRDSYSDTEPL